MACHETKYCPRCNGPFECKVGAISLCQCADVVLNELEKQFISDNYQDCLCRKCLLEIQKDLISK